MGTLCHPQQKRGGRSNINLVCKDFRGDGCNKWRANSRDRHENESNEVSWAQQALPDAVDVWVPHLRKSVRGD